MLSAGSVASAQVPDPEAAAPSPVVQSVPFPAQTEDKFTMGVFFNPISILFGFYGLELDFSPQRLFSINVSATYYNNEILGVKTSAYGGDIGVQFFLTGDRPMNGLYLYPRVAYAKAKASAGDVSAEASLIGLGATVGYQWNWQPFSMRLGGGVIDYMGGTSNNAGAPNISLRGTMPAVDFTIGFAF